MKACVSASKPAAPAPRSLCGISRPSRVKAAFAKQQAPVPADSTLEQFVMGQEWAKATVQLQLDVHDLINAQLGPLEPQPTKYALDGALYTEGPGMANNIVTSSGGAVWHKWLSTSAVPGFGMLHCKTGAYACTDLTTPFFTLEMGGNHKSTLLAVALAPRLCLLRHLDYTRKYYRSVPPGSTGLSDFNTLYNRMLDRAQSSMGITTVSGDGTAAAALAAPLYRVYTSSQLWTRLHGHVAYFTFDPCDPKAWEAVRQDTLDVAKLWCAWAKADWEQQSSAQPPRHLVDEWADRSLIALNDMDHDPDGGVAVRLLGANGFKVKETVNGMASLAPKPTWLA